MSPKLNWATRDGKLKSAMPMTAATHAAILRTVMPEGVNVLVENDDLISIRGQGKRIEVWGTKP